jgi:hypothetical protein
MRVGRLRQIVPLTLRPLLLLEQMLLWRCKVEAQYPTMGQVAVLAGRSRTHRRRAQASTLPAPWHTWPWAGSLRPEHGADYEYDAQVGDQTKAENGMIVEQTRRPLSSHPLSP